MMMGGLGLVVGVGLAVASKVFYVYVDPMISAVEGALPGANCGGCGYPGCSANAEAIVAGKSAPSSCVAGGSELAGQIAAILGVVVEAKEPDFAKPGCHYGPDVAEMKFDYLGVQDCRAAAVLHGGMKSCAVGCLGLGTCVRACPFSALSMGPAGIPVVDMEKCTGCGTCERVCPKHIINLSSVTRRMLKEYTDTECTTPCQRACPAGINIREYVRLAAEGDFEGAVRVIKERNPFPAVIGRVCPHPCEFECRRNLVDESVAINNVKRFCADLEYRSGKRVVPFKAPATGKRMAVAGGGIEGLTCAFYLARLGHSPVVLEATGRMGGLLRSAIPAERLSQDVLDWEIQGILDMGVEARLNTALGKDVTVANLLAEGHEAVYIASGGWDGRLGRKAGPAPEAPFLPGVLLLLDAIRLKDVDKALPKGATVFVGGGKTAVRAAMGVPGATVLLRTAKGEAGVDAELLAAATAQGVKIIFSAAVTKLHGAGETLEAAEYVSLATGGTATLPAQNAVFASGRCPALIVTRKAQEGAEANAAQAAGSVAWTARPPYKKPADGERTGLLAPVDPVTDWSAAVEAIGSGRRGASSVHVMLSGQEPELPANVLTPTMYVQNVFDLEEVKPLPREIMPLAGPETPGRRAPEREQGYDLETCRKEAARCLQCGLICYLHTAAEKPALSMASNA
jgi:NADPH-dependent glutamate synthase beta subunit-like oxidoreductase